MRRYSIYETLGHIINTMCAEDNHMVVHRRPRNAGAGKEIGTGSAVMRAVGSAEDSDAISAEISDWTASASDLVSPSTCGADLVSVAGAAVMRAAAASDDASAIATDRSEAKFAEAIGPSASATDCADAMMLAASSVAVAGGAGASVLMIAIGSAIGGLLNGAGAGRALFGTRSWLAKASRAGIGAANDWMPGLVRAVGRQREHVPSRTGRMRRGRSWRRA
jgi:hypothetical protein